MLIKPDEDVAESTGAMKSLNHTLPVNNLIMKIDWSKSTLEKLPECESKFYYCTFLNLSGNQLEGCLDWIIHLKRFDLYSFIVKLNLYYLKSCYLVSRLELLDVSFNKLTEIADVCGSSGTLKYLNLSNNLLKELPEWIALLSNIQNLNLSYNPLSKTSTNDLRIAKVNLEKFHHAVYTQKNYNWFFYFFSGRRLKFVT
jgi:Leucine-rich repeat (LRR) protein